MHRECVWYEHYEGDQYSEHRSSEDSTECSNEALVEACPYNGPCRKFCLSSVTGSALKRGFGTWNCFPFRFRVITVITL